MWRGGGDTSNDKQILGVSAKERNLNERSVVLYILEDNNSILLMGDVGYQAEKEIVDNGLVGQVDYLKVGHHGSKYSTTQEFLERVRPNVAIISVGEKNRYGHPTMDTLERLRSVGAEVRRTDTDGSIKIEF
jgi:competence protein ComEC